LEDAQGETVAGVDEAMGRLTEGSWVITVPHQDMLGQDVHPSRQHGKINHVQNHPTQANMPWQASRTQKQKSPE
jgi:hypothetical protein